MSNVAGKAYALNVVTPMRRWHCWLKALIFIVVRAFPPLMRGLRGLSIIHFARWAIIKQKDWPDFGQERPRKLKYSYTIFCSNFNGTWDQYIDAFSDGIPGMLDLAWYKDFGYPQSIPLGAFRRYIEHNQVYNQYYYNATPGASQREVKAALRVWMAVCDLSAKAKENDVEQFAAAYNETLFAVQNDLGQMGFAPVASLATEQASFERQRIVEARWLPQNASTLGADTPMQGVIHGQL